MRLPIRTVLAAILLLVFLLPVAIVVAAEPALVMKSRDGTIRLSKTRCSAASVTVRIHPEDVTHFRTATVTWKGAKLNACWTLLPGNTEVLLVDETGDHGILPTSAFKPEVGV